MMSYVACVEWKNITIDNVVVMSSRIFELCLRNITERLHIKQPGRMKDAIEMH